MKLLPLETSSLVVLNLVLLFLAAIEPYLLNLLIFGSNIAAPQSLSTPVSQLYALDFGSMNLILAYFIHQLIVQDKKMHRLKHIGRYVTQRAFLLVLVAVFYTSILPFFSSSAVDDVTVRQLIWLSFLPISLIFRIVQLAGDKQKQKPTLGAQD